MPRRVRARSTVASIATVAIAMPSAGVFAEGRAEEESEQATSAAEPLSTVIVTGTRGSGYRAAEASGGTKINAALRDIPQSIQVVPRQLIDDLNAVRAKEVVQYVSGVYSGSPAQAGGDNFILRGFSASEFLRDGYPDRSRSMRETANVEQIEVLKGPASVLYGRIEPGGTLNYVTKRPLATPRYAATLRTDSFGLVRATADVSTITDDGEYGLRANGAFESGGTFRDFSFSDRKFGSGVFAWNPSEDTQLSVELEALDDHRSIDRTGIPLLNGKAAPIPIERLITEPTDFRDVTQVLGGYTVQHRLSSAWKIKHGLRAYETTVDSERTQVRTLSLSNEIVTTVDPLTGDIDRSFNTENIESEELITQLELLGDMRFDNGMRHQVLVGVELDRFESGEDNFSSTQNLPANRINIYNPVYGTLQPIGLRQSALTDSTVRSWAVYAQDLIELSPRWKALIGARYDDARNTSDNLMRSTSSAADSTALSPRAGVVWQPSKRWSLYGSYSESFVPVIGQDFFGTLFEPTLGRQAELGAKSDWFGGRLSASTAVFRIKKENISVSDPDHDGFSIQTGEVTSDGIELDVAGSPLPGLSLVGNVAFIDARITKDTRPNMVGKAATNNNVPSKGGGLWASYNLQSEQWRGWGGGLGAFYVGSRENSNNARDFHTLPSYTRWDSSVWYRTEQWQLSLKLENLFDKIYFAGGSNLGMYPGAPRNYTVSASCQF